VGDPLGDEGCFTEPGGRVQHYELLLFPGVQCFELPRAPDELEG